MYDKKKIIEKIQDAFTTPEGLNEQMQDNIAAEINSQEEFKETLVDLREIHVSIQNAISQCGDKISMYNDSKKTWKMRDEQLMSLLQKIAVKNKMKSCAVGECKMSSSTRSVLDIDDESQLIDLIENLPEMQALTAVLPPWAKVSASIDKTAMKNWLKASSNDAVQFMNDNMSNVHFSDKTSFTLK